MSLAELQKPSYPLEELMPELSDLAMDQIIGKKVPLEIIQSINSWVLSKKKENNQNHLISAFVSQTVINKGVIVIKDFCEHFGIHKSTLEKNFKVETGLTPKQYANLIRFNFLIRDMLFSKKSLTETGYDLGYFDQSHMIKDFKKILNLTPGEFLEKKFAIPKIAAFSISNKPKHFEPFAV